MQITNAIIKNKEEFVIDILKLKKFIGKIVTISNCSKGLFIKKFVIIKFYLFKLSGEEGFEPSTISFEN